VSGRTLSRRGADASRCWLHLIRRERAALLARWKEVLAEEEAGIYVAHADAPRRRRAHAAHLRRDGVYGLPVCVTPDVLIRGLRRSTWWKWCSKRLAAWTRRALWMWALGSGWWRCAGPRAAECVYHRDRTFPRPRS